MASQGGDGAALLAEVITSLEFLQVSELRQYFKNSCLEEKRLNFSDRDGMPARSAVVYLLPLADRLEMIVSLPQGLARFTSRVDQETLNRTAQSFRYHLEKRTSREYLTSGQALHGWLIDPLLPELTRQGIDTLVFVPAGQLRTIPLAALHDGHGFLIDRLSVAVIPSLSLIDLGSRERQGQSILLAGLSEPNLGFAGLTHVPQEMASIKGAIPDATLLENHAFNAKALSDALAQRPYTIVHLASHGEFMPESGDSFILAWNERLGMDLLARSLKVRRYRKDPIDLLTLSACQSAATSERAVLGLAGLSLQAGVRSALATLWYVEDHSSAALMTEFYRQLARPELSKAQALQAAQKSLIADNRYCHPAYWSPFILVGNWN